MRKPTVKRPKRRASEWGLDAIMQWCKRIKGFRRAVRLTEQGLITLDEAIKQDWAEMKKNHPVQAAINLTRVKKINQLAELRKKRPHKTRVDEIMANTGSLPRLDKIVNEIKDLTTWLPGDQSSIPPRIGRITASGTLEYIQIEEYSHGPTNERVNQVVISMLNNGFPVNLVRRVLRVSRQRGRGRPASKRQLAVKVLETKLANPHLSWRQLAMRLCDCEEMDHGAEKCKDKMRKDVDRVNRLLTKYEMELPPHPGNKST